MNRRWKIALALALVGMTAFLVWAFRSPVTPPLTVRFYGYRTNTALPRGRELSPQDRQIFALFAVTNNTSRAMIVGVSNLVRIGPGELAYQSPWMGVTNYLRVGSKDFPLFNPGEGGLAELRVYRTEEPIRIFVQAIPHPSKHTIWSRYLHWWSQNDPPYSATATSQPR